MAEMPVALEPAQFPPLGECDFCGLRMAYGRVADSLACKTCERSRAERIRACAERMRRHAPAVEPEAVADDVVDLFDEELAL